MSIHHLFDRDGIYYRGKLKIRIGIRGIARIEKRSEAKPWRVKRFVARQRHRLGFAYRAERELLIFAAVISVVNKGQIYSRGSRAAENLYIHGNSSIFPI